MVETHLLEHLRKKEETPFQNSAPKYLKQNLLRYFDEVLCEMIKTGLKDTYLRGITPTELKNEVSTFHKTYYGRDNQVMIDNSVNVLYTRFLFKIDAPPQYSVSFLDITATLFKTLIPEVR